MDKSGGAVVDDDDANSGAMMDADMLESIGKTI